MRHHPFVLACRAGAFANHVARLQVTFGFGVNIYVIIPLLLLCTLIVEAPSATYPVRIRKPWLQREASRFYNPLFLQRIQQ